VVSPRDLPVLARSLGTTTEALGTALDEAMTRIRQLFEREF
jgi:hypothetical protein